VYLLHATEGGPDRQRMTGLDRSMLYLIGCYTGFRKSEIGSVFTTSFNFSPDQATLTVKAGYSKRRTEDVIPLRGDLAAQIQAWIASKPKLGPKDLLFPIARKRTADLLKDDLEAARASWIREAEEAGDEKERVRREKSSFLIHTDEAGHVVDFHALRKTFITNLARSGVMPKAAQMLARHSTIDLTMNTYTQINVLDQAAAVEALPPIPTLTPQPERQRAAATGTLGKMTSNDRPKKVPTVVPRGAEIGAGLAASRELRIAPTCTVERANNDDEASARNAKSLEEIEACRATLHRVASNNITG